ncbi:aldehyde dehydrogenase [Paraburkholderia tropica]|uniref:aldehyde dehydrogenase n=1 Tax=Paraburkholderia tropica TaxID=92647 RepID=UPI0007EC53A5|nr:aldehyde dehydrogenase [Paraburkholderia tropica]OBR54819.1 aldehyde dehydrogenase [Paraburkholderia tropica]
MEHKNLDYWKRAALAFQFEGRSLIDGELAPIDEVRAFVDRSPVDGRTLAVVGECSELEVNAAVSAARRSFSAGVWSGLNPRARKAVLLRWAALIRANLDELALLETLDSGKPIRDTLSVDVPGAAYCIEWFAEAIDKVGGEIVPADNHLVGMVLREAVGVVAAVVPWNFPLLMAAWKLAPALAAGNSVVLKPSEKSPLTAIRVAALAIEAGLPPGVLNVVTGSGDTGHLLATHDDVDCIAFTGSTNVGRSILRCAAESNLKRVWLELGGKSPNIVLADCPDLARAAKAAAAAIFYNMGEMCTAGSRLLVQNSIKDEFIAALLAEARAYEPGDPLDPATSMGAIIDETQLDRVERYIEQGKREARLLTGGTRERESTGGLYLSPTIFDVSDPSCTIAREEIFGPVLSVLGFDTLDEAIELANGTEYGLAAAVWTSDLTTAHEASRRLRAGTVWVNCYDEGGDMNFPFGGYKQSGNGRDKSLHALEKYTELKSVLVRLR